MPAQPGQHPRSPIARVKQASNQPASQPRLGHDLSQHQSRPALELRRIARRPPAETAPAPARAGALAAVRDRRHRCRRQEPAPNRSPRATRREAAAAAAAGQQALLYAKQGALGASARNLYVRGYNHEPRSVSQAYSSLRSVLVPGGRELLPTRRPRCAHPANAGPPRLPAETPAPLVLYLWSRLVGQLALPVGCSLKLLAPDSAEHCVTAGWPARCLRSDAALPGGQVVFVPRLARGRAKAASRDRLADGRHQQ